MGGRGSGSSILGVKMSGVGVVDRGKVKWRGVVADFNPNAGHREVNYERTLDDFAAVSKEEGGGKCEFLGVVDDEGFVVKVAQGTDGACTYSDEMRKDMVGKNVTHYHNRTEPTQQQIDEANEDIDKWRTVRRAFDRYQEGKARQTAADKAHSESFVKIRRAGGNPYDDKPPVNASPALRQAFAERDAAWKEMQLGMRQWRRAEQDYRDRYKAYTGKDAPTRNFGLPPRKNGIKDETGFYGGPFSAADIDSSLFAKDIKTFSASCDEGVYTVQIQDACTNDDLMAAKQRVRRLFTMPPAERADYGTKKDKRTKEAQEFQKRIESIDRKTAEEGRKKKWSKQQIVATSINRQMAYLWETEKGIFKDYHISCSFKSNPNFKPKWEM